jgi:beta-lactam-binding protein with PASTA domain
MKRILKHLIILGVITVLLLVGLNFWLKYYTDHDEPTVQVPEVEGMLATKAQRLLDDLGLEGIVSDTVYKRGAGKLNVVSQNPTTGSHVKKGRKIYLVINSDVVPKVKVPDLAGKTSLRQAKNILKRRGLELGRVIRTPDPSIKSPTDEPVFAQYRHMDSVSLTPGSLIQKYSKIDLLVGEMIQDRDSTEAIID